MSSIVDRTFPASSSSINIYSTLDSRHLEPGKTQLARVEGTGMAVFSFLFGGNGNSSKPRQAVYPTSPSSTYPPGANGDGEYDDVALGGPSTSAAYPPSRASFSAPAATAGSFVGGSGGGYSVEASYPPLPSFSRPSSHSHAPSLTSSSGKSSTPSIPSTFARLESLLSTYSPLLLDSLSPPLPYARRDEALLSLQRAIAPYVLPDAVIESYLCHDGQDSLAFSGGGGGGSGEVGLVYGLWWLPLERVEEEWRFWRRLEAAGGLVGSGLGGGDAFSASSLSSKVGGRAHPYRPEEGEGARARGGEGEEGDLEGMSAFPPGWVRARYSHPGWLPLLTDRCGNYIGVDLDPPPPSPSPASPPSTSFSSASASASSSSSTPRAPSHSRTNSSSLNNHGLGVTPQKAYGQPGQVIAFGREMDEKVVLFPGDGVGGWARFLAAFVDEVERGEVARLGERGSTAMASRWGDEETGRGGGGGSGSEVEDGEGEGVWGEQGDGLGERGYFESAGLYGDEGEEGGGRKAGAGGGKTWILRAPYRRMAAQLSLLTDGGGGIIGLLAERSRRKWRSLGVGTRTVAPNGVNGVNSGRGREPLKVVVPNGAAGGEAQPGSAATMKAGVFESEQEGGKEEGGEQENQPPQTRSTSPHPLAPLDTSAAKNAHAASSHSNVEFTFSPPSPTATFTNGPPLPPASSASSPSRASHDSARSRTSSREGSSSQYLQQPPRRSSGSQQQARQARQPRRPPPPPAPIGLPTFSELDFSDAVVDSSASSTAGYGGRGAVPIPTATWLLNDGADRPSPLQQQGAGGLMSRLSFGSSGPTPTRESLLPTSRPSSVAAASPPPASPRLSSSSSTHESGGDHHAIPVHSRSPTEEDQDGTDDVPLRVPDERSRSTAALVGGESPPTSPGGGRETTLEVVVEGDDEGPKRTASPGDQPYGEEKEGR
ncbi:hypothetical protein JCM11251_002396 [Rhodosporidiobolus azoricus]